jgi:hypothetical protein
MSRGSKPFGQQADETCKANRVEPYGYLFALLKALRLVQLEAPKP